MLSPKLEQAVNAGPSDLHPVLRSEESSAAQEQRKSQQTRDVWKKNPFKLIQLVNRAIYRMKKVLFFFRPFLLRTQQLQIISDQAAVTQKQQI